MCKVRRRCFSARMQWPGMAFRSQLVAVGKRQAGKLLAWRCRADSGNVHGELACFGGCGWSEREFWIQSPSMAALCHQASTGEEEQVSATARLQRQTTLACLAELSWLAGRRQEIKHPSRADRIHAERLHGRPV